MKTSKKVRIAAEIKAFKNTDFSDCPVLTEEQLAQMKPSHLRKVTINNSMEKMINKYLHTTVIE